MSERLRKALEKKIVRTEMKQWVHGQLGRPNPDGSYTFDVPGRKGFVYVIVRNAAGGQTLISARNDGGVPHNARLEVKMKLEYGHYVIYSRSGEQQASINPPTPPFGANIGAALAAATEKDDLVDADTLPVTDSEDANSLKKTSWFNIKNKLTALFNTLYDALGTAAALVTAHAALTIAHGATGAVVGTTNIQTLTNKTLTTPTIGSFTNAGHDHTNAAGGGQLVTNSLGNNIVTFAKMQQIATDRLLGRSTAGTGNIELITLTAFARTLIDDVDAAAARSTLGLGTIATEAETNYILAAGTRILSGDWDIGEDRRIKAEALRARDVEGMFFEDKDGKVVWKVIDGGIFEGYGTATSTRGAIRYEPSTFTLYLGVLSPTTGESTKLIMTDRTGNTIFELDPTNSRLNFAVPVGTLSHFGGSSPTAKLHVTMASSLSNALALLVERNLDAASTNAPVVKFVQDHASDDQPVLDLVQNGTGKVLRLFNPSGNDAVVGGVLFVSTTTAGNVGTGEDTLNSYSVPANTLAVNGQSIWYEAGGAIAANGNVKRLRIDVGGTDILNVIAGPATTWFIEGRITRTGVTTVVCSGMVVVTSGVAINAAVTVTLSSAFTLSITGEAVADNDLTINSFHVGWDDTNT